MKYLRLLNILPISFFIFALLALPAMAYNIDGDISDWGVNLEQAYQQDSAGAPSGLSFENNKWVPNGHPEVDFIVENNIDPQWNIGNTPSGKFAWAGGVTGTHIQRNSIWTTISPFEEPWLYIGASNPHVQPAGGEKYDIEAMYFDDDSHNMYLAIVTSMPPTGSNPGTSDYVEAGDIAIDLDQKETFSEYGYEYGIKTHPNNDKGKIIFDPHWTLPQENRGFSSSEPGVCSFETGSSSYKDPATLEYKVVTVNNNELYDNGVRNYVIEAQIPKSSLGYPSAGATANIHLAIGCGNDLIEIEPITFKHNIPEFPSIVLPVAAIMGIILILGRRKNE